MILVTGGTGLVGSHLFYKLISENEQVRAIYRRTTNLNNVLNTCFHITVKIIDELL